LFIGDVHSCADELQDLFDYAALASDDRVVFTGDLLSRGPKPREVLELFRAVRARAAVGNHEQRLIDAHRARRSGQKGPRLSPSHQDIVERLAPEDWALLEALPLLVPVPEHQIIVAHAGVDPRAPLDAQDPWTVTHIRSVDADGKPSEKWGKPWAASYRGPQHIVFGHNARRSPQVHPFATGIDTGCVYGGKLSCLVLESGTLPPPVQHRLDAIVSVAARTAYADYGRALSD
jgi:hypothetical protein